MPRRLPPLSALRPFEAAARLESFSRAADELHLTHGAVSRQVRALEDHLGTELFARHGKRVTLTAAGRGFAERVRAVLDDLVLAAEMARPARREGRLSVSVLPSFASRWLMPRLIRFMEAHPKIEVSVNASVALADFARDEIDLAIRFGAGPWPGVACEKFLDDEYFPVASPRMNRGKLPRTPADLATVRLMKEDRDYWQRWFEVAGVQLERPIEGPLFNDSTYSLQAAARGEGVALARRSIIGEDLVRGTLVRLFDIAVPCREAYWFVCPQEIVNAARIVAFKDWVKAELAADESLRREGKHKTRRPRINADKRG
ncbi:MAG TPA: transcriptional regulator GcvA [Usitatibacter sp.]|jgi:LysR family glycine cleavage system transcriptional activator|nr:transcriptional regulator GcvA [Usitatibacter sp.]